jgi:7-cyano-7-deazaguanine synthase
LDLQYSHLQHEKALVLFSGGQDSATCLVWALKTFAHVETLGFDYGQRHSVELDVRKQFLQAIREIMPEADKLGQDHKLNASVLGALGQTAMTEDIAIQTESNGLPNTFVPGRNILFFTLAGALAWRRGIRHIVGGMCETDYSGYPDCRDDTLKALQVALSLGLDQKLTLHTPLMFRSKAQTFEMAEKMGSEELMNQIVEHTHTCYLGDRSTRHEWGYGCGTCPACDLRAKGWQDYQKLKAEDA